MVKSINAKLRGLKASIAKKDLSRDSKAEYGALIMLPIMMIISIVIAANLGSSSVPQAITAASDTGNITLYSTWGGAAKTSFTAIPNFIALDYQLVFIIILLMAVVIVMRVMG
jgi:hypothetical protein